MAGAQKNPRPVLRDRGFLFVPKAFGANHFRISPARLALRSIAGRGLGAGRMNEEEVLDRLEAVGEAVTVRNKRAYFYP